MNTQITIDHLVQLKLHGMARAYQAMLTMPVQQHPTLSQFMANLAEAETQERTQKRTEKFLQRMHSAYYIFQFLKIADYLNFLRFPVYRQKFLETLYGMIRQPV